MTGGRGGPVTGRTGPFFVGVDVGGTFTDIVVGTPDGRIETCKVTTTPDDPRDGVARGERGRREPSWSNIIALTKALKVSCDDFLRPPVERPPVNRGRPPKPSGQDAEAETPPTKKGQGQKPTK